MERALSSDRACPGTDKHPSYFSNKFFVSILKHNISQNYRVIIKVILEIPCLRIRCRATLTLNRRAYFFLVWDDCAVLDVLVGLNYKVDFLID